MVASIKIDRPLTLRSSARSSSESGRKEKSAVEAKADAQRISWGPFSFQASKALRDLGILSFLQERGKDGASSQETADEIGISLYGSRVLLEAGLGIGLVHIDEEDRFTLSKTGYFVQNDPMTRVNMDFVDDVCYPGIQYLKDSVENGRPEGLKTLVDTPTIYEGLSKLPEPAKESWFAFDNYYSAQAFDDVRSQVFEEEPSVIFDVGGNIGKFSAFAANCDPKLEIKILDLPEQLELAEENLRKEGLEDRVGFHPIDLLDEEAAFPKGADIIWMSQFLDCFSEEMIHSILSRAKEALNPGGSIMIMETLWDRQRFEAASFSLQQISLYFTALANGESQMYHSKTLISQVHRAGLYVDKDIDGLGIGHTLLVCRPKP